MVILLFTLCESSSLRFTAKLTFVKVIFRFDRETNCVFSFCYSGEKEAAEVFRLEIIFADLARKFRFKRHQVSR